jgi:S-adenosylmethionine:tRNA ribosyltransferase-isomerase
MPVKSALLEQHVMHSEFIAVERATIQKLLDCLPGNIIPVGTTSLRTIESLYWLGVKTIRDPDILPEYLVVHQWDAFERAGEGAAGETRGTKNEGEPGAGDALRALLGWMKKQGITQLLTRTQLLITPGYDWKMTGALITNFHQPESTLLLLIAALIGEDWKKVYRYALDHQFRFLSYGDGNLLFRKK